MVDKFIDYISGIRRYSVRTQEIYRKVLDNYLEFCGGEFGTDILTPALIRGYEVHLLDDCSESPRTVNLHLSVLSSFCKFLMKQGVLESNPVHLIARPKQEKRLPAFYREESMKEYFRQTAGTPEYGTYKAQLSRLIVSILYGTAMRRSELIGLRIRDYDKSRRVLKIRGKGDKMREIPLISSLNEELLLYLQSVEEKFGSIGAGEEPLLRTEKGGALYPVYVDRAIKQELGAVEGISGKKSPHVLRHTLATELLNDGTDLNSIKELLGHSSLAATQVYTHNTAEKLKKVYENAHPRAKTEGNYENQSEVTEIRRKR